MAFATLQFIVGSTQKGLSKVNSPPNDTDSRSNTPAENDIILLQHIHKTTSTPILSTRLRAGKKIELQKDSIAHNDILNKSIRDLVSSRKRVNYRLTWPTLAEYTDLSPRLVTPVSISMYSLVSLSDRITVDLLPRCELDRFPPGSPSYGPKPEWFDPRCTGDI